MHKTRFMKKILLVLFLLIGNQVLIAQDLDKKTLAKIKVKLITAENSYKKGSYTNTLTKIKEIERIVGEYTYEDIQNLKIKALIGQSKYDKAKKELDALYEMDPSDEIITDIASYEDKIDNGIITEKKRQTSIRLAEIKRKERAKKAEIKRLKDKEKLTKILTEFKYKSCPECRGSGYEYEYDKVGCGKGAYVRTVVNRYVYNNYYKCKSGILYLNNGKWTTHNLCGGKGKKIKKRKTCSECKGKKKVLYYAGYPKISSYDERKHIKEHKYTIQRNIRAVQNKKAEQERKRKQLVAEKKEELKRTIKTRNLTDRIYFDANRKETLSKYNAKFYRIPQKKVNGLYVIKEYSIRTNKLRFEAYSTEVANLTSANLRGIATWYYSSSSKNVSSSYDGRLQEKSFYDNYGYKNMIIYFYLSNQGKTKLEFFNSSKSIYKTNGGFIDKSSYLSHSNGYPKQIKWTYIGSKKKYNKYFIFNIDKNGKLKSRLICNRKWKVKETVSY